MNRNKSGVSIVQYLIIIVLVSIAVVIAYTLLGEAIKTALANLTSGLEKSSKAVSFTNSSGVVKSYQPGALNGTPDNPMSECNQSTCIIDFGDYILDSIPADYSNESTSSRGSKDLSAVMNSIVKQLEIENDPPEENSSKFLDLVKKAIEHTNKISDAENVFELAAFEVYAEGDPIAKELEIYKNLKNTVLGNKQYEVLLTEGLIKLPKPGDLPNPEKTIFNGEAWVANPDYSTAILNTTQITPQTDLLKALKPEILKAAADAGKSKQGEMIAYLIDIASKVSDETQEGVLNGEDVLGVKSIIDNKDIDLKTEIMNIAKGIEPNQGKSPPY